MSRTDSSTGRVESIQVQIKPNQSGLG